MRRFLAAALLAVITLFAVTPASAQVYTSNGRAQADHLCSGQAGYGTACVTTAGDTPFAASVTTTLTQFIAAPAAGSIRITFVQYAALESATGGALEIEAGTGTNCATSTTLVAGFAWLTASTAAAGAYGNGSAAAFILPAGDAACAIVTAGTVTYAEIAGTYAVY